jgi:5-methyltetrahydrofolate--homocysteine methyltransferase
MRDLQSYLDSGGTLVADGATGTQLQAMGLPVGTSPERWNVERPDAILSHHRSYLEAGSQIILTNTFGGSRIKLERTGGLGERTVELNRAAAKLAKNAAGDQAYVAGDIGPTGELLAPFGLLAYQEAVAAFAEQATALVQGGVDLVWIETMTDLNEAKATLEGVRRVTALPVFVSLSFGAAGRTIMGVTPAQVVGTFAPMGVAAIGANCGEGIEPVVSALVEMRTALLSAGASGTPALIAKPNAGLPRLEEGRTVFDLSPQAMAAHVPRLVESGAQIIGACCGSSPAHIAAMAARLADVLRP